MAPVARSKFGAPMFEPEFFGKKIYCTEVLVTLSGLSAPGESCHLPSVTVIRHPHSASAPGESCHLPSVVTPLITERSDAPQQIMVHSSNWRHKGTLCFRRGKIFNSPEFLHRFEEKRMREFCRAMVLFQKLAQKYRYVFPDFLKSCPDLPSTSYAYSFNAETMAKH